MTSPNPTQASPILEQSPPSAVLTLSTLDRATLSHWASTAYPEEACGLILGDHRAGRTRSLGVRRTRNLARERLRDRYELDPDQFLAIDRETRARGLEIVGIWHTHPDHPALPSRTDLEKAWEGYSYLILAVDDGAVREMRSWRLRDRIFEEELIEEEL